MLSNALKEELIYERGLRKSFQNNKFKTDIKQFSPQMLISDYGSIDEVDTFNHLGAVIHVTTLDKEANKATARKMELAYYKTKNV